MIVHKNVLNSFLVNNHRLGRVDTSPPSLIFNNNNMALQVWLPLNKSGADKNQGLGDSTITNFGAVYESSGKLGGCYKCTNSAGIRIESKPWMKMVPGNSFSVSMWIKGCSGNTWAIACTSWELNFRTSILSVYPGGALSNGGCAIYQTFDNNTWYHIAFSYNGDTSKLSLYLNGEFKQEYVTTYTREGIASTITLPYGDTRYINDFRIYDHCLPPKEVKEISKGLVLHYPLNDAYVQNTTNLNKSIGTTWANWGTNTIIGDSFISPEGTTGSHIKCSSFTDGGICTTHSSFSVKPDTTYAISAKMKVTGSAHRNLFYWREYNSSNTQLSENGKWSTTNVIEYGNGYKLYYGIITTAPTASSVTLQSYFYGAGEHWIYDIQVEEGSYPTPFAGYNTSRIATTVYDCSGYQNNGTISGSLSCSADSPRYNKSCKFGSGIIGTTSGFASAQSYTFWANVVDKTAQTVFVDGASKLGFGMFSTYFICSSAGKTSAKYSTANLTIGWHHFAVVNDLLYIDGVLQEKPSGTDTWVYSGSMLEIGNRSNGNSYPWKGQISDFRVYATALSPEDIKELYNTSCIINS